MFAHGARRLGARGGTGHKRLPAFGGCRVAPRPYTHLEAAPAAPVLPGAVPRILRYRPAHYTSGAAPLPITSAGAAFAFARPLAPLNRAFTRPLP